MLVAGTLRWQVTEDCPWDLLIALALRDLAGLEHVAQPMLPPVTPAVVPVTQENPKGRHRAAMPANLGVLTTQWHALFERAVDREHRPIRPLLQPPHFTALDRALELQDLVIAHHQAAVRWARNRRTEYARARTENHIRWANDIGEVVRERERDLRRQAGYFRLDIEVLPLAETGAWIVSPRTVVVSSSLHDDSRAFRAWFRPLVAALV